MKLNWGHSIAIFYTLFVIIMVGMVFYSRTFDHSLVVDNYYEEDINYQQHIDKLNNSRMLSRNLEIVKDDSNKVLRFSFPDEIRQVGGKVLFYRASDKTKDFIVDIPAAGNQELVVPTEGLLPGLWKIKVDWEGDGKLFYKEQIVVL